MLTKNTVFTNVNLIKSISLITFVTIFKITHVTMLNTEEFTSKLQTILDYYSLTASSFADKIGVQRSSLSHLLSGRNKPSLDFVLKITDEFPEVDLYWLLLNKGSFPKENNVETSLIEPKAVMISEEIVEKKETRNNEVEKSVVENEVIDASIKKSQSSIEKIVIFYKNGTFKSYQSE